MNDKEYKLDWIGLVTSLVFYSIGLTSIIFQDYGIYRYGFNVGGNKALIFGAVVIILSIISFISFKNDFKKILEYIEYPNTIKVNKLYFLCITYCIFLFICFVPLTYYFVLAIRISFFLYVVYLGYFIISFNSELSRIIKEKKLHP